MKPPLSRYVEVDTSPERISKIWARVSVELQAAERLAADRLAEAPSVSRVLAAWIWPRFAAVAALGMALLVVALVRPWRSDFGLWGAQASSKPGQVPGQLIHSGQGATLETNIEPLAVSMDDGSGLALAPNTKIEIEQGAGSASLAESSGPAEAAAEAAAGRARVAVHLSKGKIQCDVTPNPKRRFVVHAKGVEVRVTGTSFSVELSPNENEVRVVVKAGTVEVAPPGSAGHERRLSAGEVWEINLPAASSSIAPGVEPAASAVVGEHAADASSKPGVVGEAATESATLDLGNAANHARKAVPQAHAAEPSEPVAEPASSAPQLFDQANVARRAGNVTEAVRGYEELLAKYPSDGRSGLAAFELGRLRMDRLGDLSGAVTALKRAVAMASGSGFREDAMARLVQAYAALGAKASCQSARDAYLKAYPKGVHLATVSHKCD